ncbi:AAA family ATPase [Mediterraneibacter glycyrrhizinilyticus]|uniref:AAA family ATPase n=1 Tax=Mediterraneibacter glycyrrhizinilyticus TaxID=342942 RepID=UPI0025AA4527|nr:AAA family ATPase [Mediterraneibacter glycyrrhizinilyticus]MDN0060389.1 AAA family ATPase [Mediterraneibacter glycyrrhizinilyticus]
MGIYLNSESAYTLYKSETQKPYFVDKSRMIEELFPLIEEGANHICITRPRRFGKTVTANMISAFFSRAREAADIFDRLKISTSQNYNKYRNQYNVIHISLNDISRQCTTYEEYITRIEQRLVRDLKRAYPQAELDGEESAVDALMEIYTENSENRFIFVFDEWDFLFHQPFVTEKEKREYLSYLRSLLKDRPYVILAYMTGILPIAKYSSGSELNMFTEYTMLSEEKFSEVFGFTDSEVDTLYQKYTDYTEHIKVTREGLRYWYNGYHTFSGERVYNPRSVVCALRNNNLGNYWTSAGPYDEIYYYIENNVAAVRDDLALMVSGIPVPAKIREYAATSMNLNTKDEIFSSMVVYGFLSYENGKVSIPNKELMDRFDEMLQREPSLGYVYRLARTSDRMLGATLSGDVDTMAEILELAHDTEVPLLRYNNETELSAVVNLVYLSARDRYRVEREDKAGTGYVDFIFYPETDKSIDCIILELNVDSSPEEAIRQIKTRKYDLRFRERIGEEQKYTGRILAVGISYNKKTKKHICRVEVLQD